MTADGIIQFHYQLKQAQAIDDQAYEQIEPIRKKAYSRKWIGTYPNGIGYGNISCRIAGVDGFYISASQTGHLSDCLAEHYCHIHSYDYSNNQVSYSGCLPPSSESLTHAMFYELDHDIGGVLHIHHASAWKQLKFQLPTSCEDTPYGTIEMAMEIKRLYQEQAFQRQKILIMAGHEDGIISFGKNLGDAFATMQRALTTTP